MSRRQCSFCSHEGDAQCDCSMYYDLQIETLPQKPPREVIDLTMDDDQGTLREVIDLSMHDDQGKDVDVQQHKSTNE